MGIDHFSDTDKAMMHHAMMLALRAESEGEVPIGAVLVQDGRIIGEGWNQTISLNDPTAHAEIMALRAAGVEQSNHRLPGCELYVTLEPCCMCAGAIIHARLSRVVYAARDPKTGAAGSRFDILISDQHNHKVTVESGLQENQSAHLLKDFFARRRREAKD